MSEPAWLAERLTAELARDERSGAAVTLDVLDLDDFKAINDGHGHSAGDELLCCATRAMTAALRPGDALGRLGGDEFAALLPHTDPERGRTVADRLRIALSPRISASVGVASSRDDGPSAELLYRFADEHLYQAKRGRSGVRDSDEQALAG